jgi:hypothetical protein
MVGLPPSCIRLQLGGRPISLLFQTDDFGDAFVSVMFGVIQT